MTLLLSASLVLLSLPVASANVLLPAEESTDDSCAPDPCAAINLVCRKVLGGDCVRAGDAEADVPLSCINCDPFNRVCQRLFGVNCLA